MALKESPGFLLPYIVNLVAWAVPVVLGVVMIKRGGVKPECLFLAGSLMMVLDQLVTIIWWFHKQSLIAILVSGANLDIIISSINSVNNVYSIISSLFSLAGIAFLSYAFWLKFSTGLKKPVTNNT